MKNLLLASLAAVFMISCSDGDTGATGAQGPAGQNGAPGAVGPTGPQGAPGQDASGVTVVQLCPGNSNYGTFVEVGFCIDGKLYATYSTNGGFSTLIAPGTYSSNGINSSCTFTVVSGCILQ